MFRFRLIFKLMVMLLVFAVALIVPVFLSTYKILTREGIVGQRVLHRFYTDMPGILFYAFFIALVISLAFARRILLPVKLLKEAAMKVKEGELDVSVQKVSDDELGEVTEIFNHMVKSLKEKNEELQKKELYVDAMMDAIWVVDEYDRIIDINPAFTKIFGYTRQEVINAFVYDFYDEDERREILRDVKDRKDRGLPASYKTYIYAKDGRKIPVMITEAPIIKNSDVVGRVGVIKDISEVERLMSEMEASRAHLEAIMQSLEDALVVIGRDYRVLQANRVAMNRYGKDIAGKKCYEVFHLESGPCWLKGEDCPVNIILTEPTPHRSVHRHYIEDGRLVFEDSHSSPIRDRNGEVIGILQVLRDVTEQIHQENELRKRNQELELLNRVSSILSSSLRAKDVLTRVLQYLIETLEMDGGGVFLLDDKTKTLSCAYHIGVSEDFVRHAGRVKVGQDIPGRVAITGEVITTSDISTDRRVVRSILKHSGIKGYCCIPIKGKEKTIGVYCLFKYKEHFFEPDDERLLESVGEITGLALENIKLYEQMKSLFENQRQRRLREQQILLNLSSSLISAFDITDVMEQTLLASMEYLMADAAVIWEVEQNHLVVKLSKGIKPANAVLDMDILSPETMAVKNKKEVYIQDLVEEKDIYYFDQSVLQGGFRTMLCCPVMVGTRVMGVITLFNSTRRLYPEEEIHFFRILVSIFSVAYERTLFYERSIAEKSLAESILNSILEGVCTVGLSGKILNANRSISHILDIPLHEIIDKHHTEVFKGFRDSSPVEQALKGRAATAEMVIERNGKERVIQVTSVPLRDSANRVYAAVQVLRDVTKEKEVDKLKTEIIRSVSHEFRTPLSAIVGMTEMLIDGEVTGTRMKDYLKIIYDEGLRLSEMVSQLLDISRLEGGMIEPVIERVKLMELIDTLNGRFNERFRHKQLTFSYRIDEGATEIFTDKEMLLQVLTNLIDNSSKYCDPGASIQLTTTTSEDYVIIEVADTGWGIPEEELRHVSKRFFRGLHGQKTKGTGLGLTLCAEIIKKLQGRMEIESTLGEGTRVRIWLPYKAHL